MRNLIKIIAFILGLATVATTYSQIKTPVTWKWEMKRTAVSEAELIFTAAIENKWHIYATEIEGIGPIPTSVEFEKSKDFETVGKLRAITKPHVSYDSAFGIELGFFSKKAVLSQKIKIRSEKDFDIKGYVTSQACNDITCIAPQDVDFVFHIGKNDIANNDIKTDTVAAIDTQAAVIAVDTLKTNTVTSSATIVAEKEGIGDCSRCSCPASFR